MKSKILSIMAVLLVCAALMSLTSCSQWGDPYDALDKEGSAVSVKYIADLDEPTAENPSVGVFANTNGVTVVNVYDIRKYTPNSSGKVEIALTEPNDKNKGNNTFSVSKDGHILAGWFVAEPRVNANGEPLDNDGNLVSESGKPQGYLLGEKWDFSTDKLTLDAVGEYSSSSPELTLVAKWMPYVSFEFYEKEGTGFKLLGTKNTMSLELPEWKDGSLNYKTFLSIPGRTYKAAYLDEAMTELITSKVEGVYNYETGELETKTIKIYTEWLEGEWYQASTVSQFKSFAKKGNIELLADLDFTGEVWPTSLTGGSFTGTIEGNGHTIKGITATGYSTKGGDIAHGGIFGSLGEGAVIRNVTFSDVTYTVMSAVKATSASFGLFAGDNLGATLENVTLKNSVLVVSKSFVNDFAAKIIDGKFVVGLVIPSGDTAGITTENVTYSVEDGANATVTEADGVLEFTYPE